ncbi:hypothetical protein B0H13DRAFT_1867961 [Mycena leptocephala]|nr:hypothetical protein B0H13DRAFT_1867961 [Mycena leptocephala]
MATLKPQVQWCPLAIFTAKPTALSTDSSRSRWQQKARMAATLRAIGLPEPEPMLVVVFETETRDALLELTTEPSVRTLVGEAMRELDVHNDSSVFAADVITKFERA